MANPRQNEPMFSGLDSFDEDNTSLAASLLTTTGPLDNSPAVSGAFNPAASDWSMPFQDGLPYESLENNGAFGGLYNPNAFTFQSPWEGSVQFSPQAQQQQQQQQGLPQGPVGQFSSQGKQMHTQPGVNRRGTSRANSGSESPYPGAATKGLTIAQQEQLKNIAMPAHLKYRSPKSEGSPQSSGGDDKGPPSSPDMSGKSNRKRKSSAEEEDDDDEDDDDQQPVKKTAHNMIEKRYRTNLNDKIAALRDSVPSLRIMSKSARGEDTTEDREELHGLTPAHKLNKATVLSKATEYIRHLEKRNNRLADENATMQQRISAFEKLFMHGAMNGTMSPIQPPTPIQYSQDPSVFVQTPLATPRGPEPQGMIQVPEEMKRIIQAQAATGRPYPVPQHPFHPNPAMMRQQIIQQQQQQVLDQSRWQNAGPYFGKLMVGSLAALMVLEVVRESEQSNESPKGRGLFGAPLHFLGSIVSKPHISIGGYHVSTPQLLHSLKLLVLMGSLLWVFVPRLFVSRSKMSPKMLQANNASLQAVPSLASPIHVRRQAWLTAIQTVWVPRHNFFLEAAALILKTMKLSLRNTIGIHGYQLLTGLTEDQETARVKAWTIALDAQLAGGDVEINKSRLTLTLLASGTLPDTPLRLMLKALHCRILLLQETRNSIVDLAAAKVARAKWNEAKELHRMIQQLKRKDDQSAASDDELPEHLALLLQQDCDSVFSKDIVQRAHNLAWNRPTTYNVCIDKDGMNAVVEDPAVRSPMDAVAAWLSCSILQDVLSTALMEGAESDEDQAQIAEKLELATKVAPIGSNAQLRALVARAVLVDEKRGTSIAKALSALEPTLNPDKHPSYSGVLPPLIDSPMSLILADANVQMSLRCAMAIAHLPRFTLRPRTASLLIESVFYTPAEEVTLLGVTAAFRLMNRLHKHSVAKEQCVSSLEQLAGTLRVWIGGAASDSCGLDTDVRQHMVERCLTITKSVMGMEIDQGYASMSDCEAEEGGC